MNGSSVEDTGARLFSLPARRQGLQTWAGSGSGVSTQEQALELLAVALHHPASEQETRDRAQRLWGKLASSLPPDAVLEAENRGKARALDTVLRELLHT